MNSAQRTDLLKRCVAQLVSTHMDFVQTADTQITPKHPFWVAADALCEAFDDENGEIPANCRRIFVAVWGNGEGDGGFKRAWRKWTTREQTKQNPTWKPGPEVWAAYRHLKEQMRVQVTQPRKLVEPIADLVAQGLNDEQIARCYEKSNSFGAPDTEWVRWMKADLTRNTEETRMLQRAKIQTSAEQWADYAAQLAASPDVSRVLEMLEAGVDPETSTPRAHMTERSEGPKLAYGRRNAPEPQPEEQYDSYQDSPITVEQRAVMLLDEGTADHEIVQQLGISGQKLGAIKRRADEIRADLPQAAEV